MAKNTLTVEISNKLIDELEIKQALIERDGELIETLRAENERQSKELAEQSIKLLVSNEVVAERDALRAAINRNRTNALEICTFASEGLDYADAQSVIEMALNIVNDLGEAYGIGDES